MRDPEVLARKYDSGEALLFPRPDRPREGQPPPGPTADNSKHGWVENAKKAFFSWFKAKLAATGIDPTDHWDDGGRVKLTCCIYARALSSRPPKYLAPTKPRSCRGSGAHSWLLAKYFRPELFLGFLV